MSRRDADVAKSVTNIEAHLLNSLSKALRVKTQDIEIESTPMDFEEANATQDVQLIVSDRSDENSKSNRCAFSSASIPSDVFVDLHAGNCRRQESDLLSCGRCLNVLSALSTIDLFRGVLVTMAYRQLFENDDCQMEILTGNQTIPITFSVLT